MADKMYDPHCHIFNIEYLMKEAISMLWDISWGRYPFDPPRSERVAVSSNEPEITANIWEFLRWLFQVCDVAFNTEEQNMKFLRKAARRAAWPLVKYGNKLVIVPLMMDIFYMYAYQLQKDQNLRGADGKAAAAKSSQSARPAKDDIEAFRGKIIALIPDKNRKSPAAKRQHDLIKQFFNVSHEPIDWTWGFKDHYLALKRLARWHKKQVYPFFALDPRRPGVIDALLNGALVDKANGPFYGIKLYPRMGYHPACAPMMDVYRYCAEHSIPITTHTGKGGFPFDDNWPLDKAEFGNPANFVSILQQYNNLIIDFAHFGLYGNKDTWENWGNKIAGLMQTYPRVYSDFACYTKEEDIAWVKEKFWNIKDAAGKYIVRERTMFGTDFDVMYFTNIGDIDQEKYFKQFKAYFTTDEIVNMSHTVPEQFLMG